jgi:hypothetical protein
MDFNNMTAADVTAYVNQKYPEANSSPLAQAFDAAQFSNCAIDDDICEAVEHAHVIIDGYKANGIVYDEESISTHIESNFPHLDIDTCDSIARIVCGDRS